MKKSSLSYYIIISSPAHYDIDLITSSNLQRISVVNRARESEINFDMRADNARSYIKCNRLIDWKRSSISVLGYDRKWRGIKADGTERPVNDDIIKSINVICDIVQDSSVNGQPSRKMYEFTPTLGETPAISSIVETPTNLAYYRLNSIDYQFNKYTTDPSKS